jgi:hypothetical protein
MTNTEKQRAFKERMYAAGYKQKMVWVPRNPERARKMSREVFLRRFTEMTDGLDSDELSELFSIILNMTGGVKAIRN